MARVAWVRAHEVLHQEVQVVAQTATSARPSRRPSHHDRRVCEPLLSPQQQPHRQLSCQRLLAEQVEQATQVEQAEQVEQVEQVHVDPPPVAPLASVARSRSGTASRTPQLGTVGWEGRSLIWG